MSAKGEMRRSISAVRPRCTRCRRRYDFGDVRAAALALLTFTPLSG